MATNKPTEMAYVIARLRSLADILEAKKDVPVSFVFSWDRPISPVTEIGKTKPTGFRRDGPETIAIGIKLMYSAGQLLPAPSKKDKGG